MKRFEAGVLPPYLLTLGSPLLLWLAFPGGGEWWPLMIVALVPFLVAVTLTDSARQAFFLGLVCGTGHYLLLMYWIILVLHQYGGLPWLVAFLALLLLAFYMAGYFALFAVAARKILAKNSKICGLLALPALWVGLDWVRSWLFSGFPWMDLGYSLYGTPVLIQIADLAGHYGITYVLVIINAGLLFLFSRRLGCSRADQLIVAATIVAVVAAALGYSHFRMRAVARQATAAPQARIGIVQGNIDQNIKWSPSMQRTTVQRYLELTGKIAGAGQPGLVVWPETALPFYPVNNPLMQTVEEESRLRGMPLLTGAPMYRIADYDKKEIQYFNSAILIGGSGGDYLQDRYDKSHLVPFGEYVPLQQYLPFIAPLVEAAGNFTPGSVERPLSSGRMKLGVLICFESVFSDLTRKWVEAGANVLVNLTNDAWYGKSSAPHHSLAMTVLRVVETRRSLVRSANTGISAFIEPTGKIDVQSGLFVPWAAVGRVALMNGVSFWVSWGYFFPPLCLLFGLLAYARAAITSRSGATLTKKNWQ